MEYTMSSERELKAFGARIGAMLEGGEVIELVGDVGAGKTTLAKAIASGMGVMDDVGSPSYTLSQVYDAAHGRRLAHYDFYRLDDPGIMADELRETLSDRRLVTLIEWGEMVAGVVPYDHIQIHILPLGEVSRHLIVMAGGDESARFLEKLR